MVISISFSDGSIEVVSTSQHPDWAMERRSLFLDEDKGLFTAHARCNYALDDARTFSWVGLSRDCIVDAQKLAEVDSISVDGVPRYVRRYPGAPLSYIGTTEDDERTADMMNRQNSLAQGYGELPSAHRAAEPPATENYAAAYAAINDLVL